MGSAVRACGAVLQAWLARAKLQLAEQRVHLLLGDMAGCTDFPESVAQCAAESHC